MVRFLRATVTLLLTLQPFAFGIMNDQVRRDSYLSAYMDSQSSTEVSAGVVYPEPLRTYGSPQPKPMLYYGPPSVPPGPPNGYPNPHYPPSGPPQDYPEPPYPLLETMLQLPLKLEFVPKLVTSFLGATHLLLKLFLLKLVLKFVVMFCLFLFLPKLDMWEMAIEPEKNSNADTLGNSTIAAPANDEEEGRLNRMANFVLDSVENQPFLKKYCNDEDHSTKCKILTMLTKMDEYVTTPRLIDSMKNRSRNYQKRSTASKNTKY